MYSLSFCKLFMCKILRYSVPFNSLPVKMSEILRLIKVRISTFCKNGISCKLLLPRRELYSNLM